MNQLTAPKNLSEEERAKRQAAVNNARGSVRLEGFILNEAVNALSKRYVDGEITLDQHTAAILELFKK